MRALRVTGARPTNLATRTGPSHEPRPMSARTAVVTGCNTGIGRVTAEALGRQGFHVILANRSEERTRPVLDAIRAAGGAADFARLDLGDLESVRSCARSIVERGAPVPLLVNNAGLAGQRGHTKDGFELAFGTNHLGPYLFTRLLLPAIEAAAKESGHARIVNVSSKAHYDARGFDWDAVRNPTASVTGLAEYAISKLSNVLFTRELARRVSPAVHVHALHPGVVASDAWRSVPWGVRHLMKLFMLSNEQGARTTLWCATSPDVAEQTGRYYDTCKEKRPSALALDDSLARTLWDRSAAWTGLTA